MFMSHRRRVITLPTHSSSEDDSSSNSQNIDLEAELFGDNEMIKVGLKDALVGFKTESRLDRKLLQGVLEKNTNLAAIRLRKRRFRGE